ncbi:MAG TPA: hypothetical protein VNU68_35065 [Verrucomicrobiae bacterium]|nr:hypothetical protein [Verrucomicrobiae bacterium]
MKSSTKKGNKARSVGAAVPATFSDHDWQAREALSTLKRAEEIKRDPKLMDAVKKHAATEREVLGKVMRRKT